MTTRKGQWRLAVLLACLCMLGGTGCGKKTSCTDLLKQADAAYQNGDYGRAAYIYNRLKKRGEFRDNAAICVSLGSTYLALNWLHHAGSEFSEAIGRNGQTNLYAWLGLGECYALTNDWDNAKLCYAHARICDPQNLVVQMKLGTACYHLRDYDHAIYYYNFAAGTDADSAALHTAMGLCHEQMVQYNKAAVEYEKAARLDPTNAMLACKLALLYATNNIMPRARIHYERLRRLDASLARSRAAHLETLLRDAVITNPLLSASAPTSTAAAIAAVIPTATTAYVSLLGQGARQVTQADRFESLALLSLTNNHAAEAIGYYKKALDADPKRAYYNRAIALVYERELRDINFAIKYYDKYLETCKDDAQSDTTLLHVNALREMYRSQDAELVKRREAEEKAQREAEEQRRREAATRSNAYVAVSREPQDYDGVLKAGVHSLQPDSLDLVKARDCFQKAIRINPSYPDAYYNVGLVCVKQTNMAESVEYFKTALKKDPKYARAYLALGMVYEQLKRTSDAIEHYNYYLELAPNDQYADSIRNWLTKNAGAR